MPEYGAWMVEAVPAAPYNGYLEDLLLTEQSMQLRRQRLHLALECGEIAPSMSNFPMLGVAGYNHFSGEGVGAGVDAGVGEGADIGDGYPSGIACASPWHGRRVALTSAVCGQLRRCAPAKE